METQTFSVPARHLDWNLDQSPVPIKFKPVEDEVGFKVRIAAISGSMYSYTHDPAPETNNRTEARFDDVTATLKLFPTGQIDLGLSFRWFSRHRGAHVNLIVPIVFELRNASKDLLIAINLPYLGWDCTCGPDPGRALYQRQVVLQEAQQAWFKLVDYGVLVLPTPLKGDKGPVCG